MGCEQYTAGDPGQEVVFEATTDGRGVLLVITNGSIDPDMFDAVATAVSRVFIDVLPNHVDPQRDSVLVRLIVTESSIQQAVNAIHPFVVRRAAPFA